MTKLFHTVNSGIIIYTDTSEIFIDVFHTGKEVGLSDTPPSVIKGFGDGGLSDREKAKAGPGDVLRNPPGKAKAESGHLLCASPGKAKVILATHSHPDHFDQSLVRMLCDGDRTCLCYCPGYEGSNINFIPVNECLSYFDVQNIRCYLLKTLHQGPQFKDVENAAYIVKSDIGIYIFLGDTELTGSTVAQLKALGNAKAVFVNYYHLASEALINYLRSGGTKNVVLYHLPFEEDDLYHCRLCANQVMKRYPADIAEPVATGKMDWVKLL